MNNIILKNDPVFTMRIVKKHGQSVIIFPNTLFFVNGNVLFATCIDYIKKTSTGNQPFDHILIRNGSFQNCQRPFLKKA